jgi:hypothetical protein
MSQAWPPTLPAMRGMAMVDRSRIKKGVFLTSSPPDARGFVVAHQKRQGEVARLELLDEFPVAELHERVARLALRLQQLREKVRQR